MTDAFHLQIEKALANPNLQAALDANAERRISVRQQAFASLADPEALREKAHVVRAETIAHLDEYLKIFTERLQEHGIQVHRAANAAQAVEQVLALARQNGARLVAKSKTMVGEEIEINHALEAAGIRAVETDLGEYIVQLRGERPAHIITPAVHLRRADVGQTFHEKLDVPFTDDIATMTNTARRVLRQTFLDADIGISGVNFGVAESGTLCVLTNEGNGRMVTTLPKVHIALMGMERLVPTLEDLALMLALLPRSATGQKLTVYTSLIQGPRRMQDPDGPQERHLILLDNGREVLRQSPLREALYCIRCGACLNACPVFREIGGHAYVGANGESTPYPGPIGSVVSPGLFGEAEFGNLARASSLCGACREACPVKIDLPKLLLRVRAGQAPDGHTASEAPGARPQPENRASAEAVGASTALRWGLRGFVWAARKPSRFTLAQRAAGWAGRLFAPSSGWLRLPVFTGWGASRDFPRPAEQSFHQLWRQGKGSLGSQGSALLPPSQKHVPSVVGQPARPVDPGASLFERFSSELEQLGGTVTLCQPKQVNQQVAAFLAERQVHSLLAWEAEGLPPGILEAVAQTGVEILHRPDPQAQAGLTGALAAVAETGTLALPGGQGRLLSASLLPKMHIAILRLEDLRGSLAEVLQMPALTQAAASILISGPSRTADIEMTLTIGVHGPGELHVFCVAED